MTLKKRFSRVFAKAKDRPYSFISRNNNKTKILHSTKRTKIFETGNKELEKDPTAMKFVMYTNQTVQVHERTNEIVRLLFLVKISKLLGSKDTKSQYFYKYNRYCHQILRVHTMASSTRGISVDRISCGMKNAFGKAIGLGTRLKKGDSFLTVYLSKKHQKLEKRILEELRKLLCKLPFKGTVIRE